MSRSWLFRILLCGLIIVSPLASVTAAQTGCHGGPRPTQLPVPNTPTVPLRYNRSYQKWIDEDVVYITTEQERADFAKLATDHQRDRFIEDFWERRNPSPGLEANASREEHYRRIAFTNKHFATDVPGWKTDRGRLYLLRTPGSH